MMYTRYGEICLLPDSTNYLSASWRGGVKDPGLHLAGQGGVDGQDDELGDLWTQRLHPLVQDLTGRVDLLLTWGGWSQFSLEHLSLNKI